MDEVWGDYRSDYYEVSGFDTFAYGSGYTKISDWEVEEEVWWLDSSNTIHTLPTVDDISVTPNFSDQTTKIGTFDDQGQVINRLEINGS